MKATTSLSAVLGRAWERWLICGFFTGCALASPWAYAQPGGDSPPGLVAYWPADGNGVDAVGSNHCLLVNGATYAAGYAGQAFNLDGVDDKVLAGSPGSLDLGAGNGFSIELWVKPLDVPIWQFLVEWNDGVQPGLGWIVSTGSQGWLYANLIETNGLGHSLYYQGPIVASQFHHVALTYDKATGAGYLYLNGAVVAAQHLGTFRPQTTSQLFLGHPMFVGLGQGPLRGLLDEVRIYNRALSSDEVSAAHSRFRPPSLAMPPRGQIVTEGGSAVFSVIADGTPPFSYQWRFNNTNIPGATNASYTLANAQATNAGPYRIVVRNPWGAVTSVVAQLTVRNASACGVFREVFLNIPGYTAADLTTHPSFPEHPSIVEVLTANFEAPQLVGDCYGQRLRALLLPPQTGEYTFYIASDDSSQLFLSIDDNPVNKRAIASVPTNTGSREWQDTSDTTNAALQKSGPISLTAGRAYYIEVLMKEQYGEDWVAVAWQKPGDPPPNNGDPPISAAYLRPYLGPAVGYSIVGWGDNRAGQFDVPPTLTNAVAMAGGSEHSVALTSAGAISAWGSGANWRTAIPPSLKDSVAIAATAASIFALRDDGVVSAWGGGDWDSYVPPEFSAASEAIAIAVGFEPRVVLRADGTMAGWMRGGSYTDVPPALTNAVAIAAGEDHSLALRNDGTVVAWGWQATVPPGLTNVVAIAAGFDHSLALRDNGTVVAWGDNNFGQTEVPTDLTNAVAVAAGMTHSLALRNDGTVAAWGARATVNEDVVPPNLLTVAAGPLDRVILTFSEAMDPVTAGDIANYAIDGGNLEPVSALVNGPVVVLRTTPQTPGQTYSVQVYSVTDLAGNPLATNSGSFKALVSVREAVLRESFFNLPGGNVITTLTQNVKYPDHPDATDLLTTFNSPQSAPNIDNYGVRLRAYLIPNETGNYQFEHYSDDAGISYISLDGNPAHLKLLATETTCCGHRTSPQVFLTAGMVYYLESIFQESWGGDYLVLSWKTPSNPSFTPIPSWYLAVAFNPASGPDPQTFANIAGATGGTYSMPRTNTAAGVNYGQSIVPSGLTNVVAIASGFESLHSLALVGNGSPHITVQPVSWTVATNTRLTLTVKAVGSPSLRYQWLFNGTEVQSATNSNLTISSFQGANMGGYQAVVSNSLGSETSRVAKVVGPLPPVIVRQPASLTVTQGQIATFSVDAAGYAPVGYQWRFNSTNIPGATNPTYRVASAQSVNAGAYTLKVSTPFGSITSTVATLTVRIPPAITQPPASLTVTQGNAATFTVVATGDSPLSYQWRFDDTDISGATSASHTVTGAQATDAGPYRVVVTNPYGAVTSAVATLTVLIPPSITQQPLSLTITQGQSAEFTVTATGDSPLWYQWQLNGTNILDATNTSHEVTNAGAAHAGGYTVVVGNPVGSVTSTVATLTVRIPPAITQPPANLTVAQGSTATFTVSAAGDSPLSYQWRFNDTDIPGATGASHTVMGAQATDTGPYRVVVTNPYGAVTSAVATLTVLTPPFIRQQPVSLTVTQGQSGTFTVMAVGAPPLGYQWQLNGTNIMDATNTSHAVTDAQAANAGPYTVIVSNGLGPKQAHCDV